MLKAAVVGTKPPFGRISNIAKLSNELEIVALCDLREEATRECAEKFGVAQVFSDFNQMIEVADFDILYSFTGTYSRPDQVVAAAQAGKHIFTEKPLALSVEEGRRMVDAVRAAGVKYQIGYQLRTYYFARALKALVEQGVLGEITSCLSRRFMPAQHWQKDGQPTWYGLQEKSGGITVDYTTHDIDLLRSLMGDVSSVFASIRRARCKTADDNVWSVLEFGSSTMGMIGASFSATFGSTDIGLFGTEGSAMAVGYQDVKVKLWGQDEKPASELVEVEPDPEDISVVQHQNFLRCLAEDREPSPNVEDGCAAIQVALAMQESSETGLKVEIQP